MSGHWKCAMPNRPESVPELLPTTPAFHEYRVFGCNSYNKKHVIKPNVDNKLRCMEGFDGLNPEYAWRKNNKTGKEVGVLITTNYGFEYFV